MTSYIHDIHSCTTAQHRYTALVQQHYQAQVPVVLALYIHTYIHIHILQSSQNCTTCTSQQLASQLDSILSIASIALHSYRQSLVYYVLVDQQIQIQLHYSSTSASAKATGSIGQCQSYNLAIICNPKSNKITNIIELICLLLF